MPAPCKYWHANLGGKALREIQAILEGEKAELKRIQDLCFTECAKNAGTENIAKIDRIIKDIDSILS